MRIRILLILLFTSFVFGYARKADTDSVKVKNKQWQGDAFRGLSIHADIGSPIIGVLGGKIQTYELQLDFNIYRKLYPIIEAGYASAQKTSSIGYNYETKAPFFRIGLNYGLLRPFTDKGEVRSLKCYPFVGIRYSFTTMNYKISNIEIKDDYWGTSNIDQFNSKLTYSGWLELVAGVRVDIYKGFTMGWSVRLKTLLHTSAPSKSHMWYVPGYGKTGDVGVMFNYTIGYTFYCGADKK